MIDEQKVRAFWAARGEKYGRTAFESIANLEEDPDLLALKTRLEQEQVMPRLRLGPSTTVLDLGAGVGQWSFRFAPLAARVTAVEYTPELAEIGREEARRRGTDNVEFVISAAEDYAAPGRFDRVFISGLFVYLTDDQAGRLLRNLRSFVADDGMLFLRDGTSILPRRHLIENRWSEVLKTDYSAMYRTRDEYVALFREAGFRLAEDADMFEEGCPLNKYPETRLRFYVFHPEGA